MSCGITYPKLARSIMHLWEYWWVDKTWSDASIRFFAKWLLYVQIWVSFPQKDSQRSQRRHNLSLKLSTWLKKLHHKCFLCVLKILEQLISEHLQTDNSAVEEMTPTRIHSLKFQASKQLFSNPQLVHVTAIKSLTVF